MNISYISLNGERHQFIDQYARDLLKKQTGITKCIPLSDYDESTVGTDDNPGDDWDTMFFLTDLGTSIRCVVYDGKQYQLSGNKCSINSEYDLSKLSLIFDSQEMNRTVEYDWQDPYLKISVMYNDEQSEYLIHFTNIALGDIPLVFCGEGSIAIDCKDESTVYQIASMSSYTFDDINDFGGLSWSQAASGLKYIQIPDGGALCVKNTQGVVFKAQGNVYVDGRLGNVEGHMFEGDFIRCGQDLLEGCTGDLTQLFEGCKRLKNTPRLITGDKFAMFAGCDSLSDVFGITDGSQNMFEGCKSLVSVSRITCDDLKDIACIFKGCERLRSITLEVGVIDDGIYNILFGAGNSGLLNSNKEIDVPDGWTIKVS